MQLKRCTAKCERLQSALTDLSQQVLESKTRELGALDKAASLQRELELQNVRMKAWLEQIDAEKEVVGVPRRRSAICCKIAFLLHDVIAHVFFCYQ